MRTPIDRRLVCIIALVVTALLAPAALPAQESAAQQEEIPAAPILVDLELATVRVVVASDVEPGLRWWKQRPEDPGVANLTASEDASGVTIVRPDAGEGEVVSRLVVEISVRPTEQVSVVGRDLDLKIERLLSEADLPDQENTEGTQHPTDMAPIDLHLESSQVSLVQTGLLTATFERCIVESFQTRGFFDLSLGDTDVQIEGHRGNLKIEGHGSNTRMRDHRGKVNARIDGGSIAFAGAYGSLDIDARSAQVEVSEWRGSGIIAANHATAEFRNSNIQTLNLKGSSSQIRLAQSRSKTTADFTDGSLSLDEVTGDVTATARFGARFDFVDHKGKVKLNLLDDSTADLRGIRGAVTATAYGAELTIDDANSVSLKANRSWITIASISKLTSFEVTRSDVELDLSDSSERKFELTAKADSSIQVQLKTPCRVDASGSKATAATDIDVVGCELKLAQGGRWSSKRVRGVDGNLPTTLTAKLSQSARLTVEGRP
jgi:hypothetical protein